MKTTNYLFFILAAAALSFGCSHVKVRSSEADSEILYAAIRSLDDPNSTCKASEYSTEDSSILDSLRNSRYEVISHKLFSDDGTYHEFMLKNVDSNYLVDATVYVANGKCKSFYFSKIVD